MNRSLTIVLVTALVVAVGAVALFINGPRIMQESARRSLMSGVRVGTTRSEVIAAKGQPDHVAHSLKEVQAPGHYLPIPSRPVEKEVLEYNKFVWRLYVYIGRDDRVTYLHLART